MSDEKYVITVNMPVDKSDLISEIKSLKRPVVASKPAPVEEPEEEVFTMSSLNKKKKEKKKKKNKGLGIQLFSSTGETSTVSTDEEEDSSDISLIDIEELFREDDEERIDDLITDEQKKNYDKLKKDENPYKKEFAEELTLLYNLLDEINKFGKKLDKKYDTIESSKTRGISKYTNDLILTILNSKQSRLSVIKEITAIKKTIADLKIKADGKSEKNQQGGASAEVLASTYLKNVLKYGRNNFVKEFASNRADDEDHYDELLSTIEKKREANEELLDTEKYLQMIDDRLDEEDNPYRSDAGSKYIQYENRGVQIWIKKCVDTGEWEFVALDKDKQQIFDYPLPTKRSAGKMKFSEDSRYATDETGRSYKVFEYFSPDEDED